MITILDGAMGTELMKRGTKPGAYPETLNLTAPDDITAIHRQYAEAGSRILYANTFSANPERALKAGYDLKAVIDAAIGAARAACDGEVKIALDVGSLGSLLEPYGDMSAEEAYDAFSEIVKAGNSADLIAIETMTDLNEAEIALKAAKDCSQLPVFVTMSFAASGRTIMGNTPSDMAERLSGHADAIGINCSLGPEQAMPLMLELKKVCGLPLILKPNAGLPEPDGSFKLGAAEFAEQMLKYVGLGISYMGGCCGTAPAHIAELNAKINLGVVRFDS